MPITVLFPGQGAATPGFGRAWVDHPAWAVVDQAEQVLGCPLAPLLLTADAAELATTRTSQLAVLLGSLVAWEAVRPALGYAPLAFAGHSLGQVTAVLAAEALTHEEGFRVALARAEACQTSADVAPGGPGRMVALLGASLAQAEELCAAVEGAYVANDNAPGQVVVAGGAAAMADAQRLARSYGIRRTSLLPVGHAFHTPLLADAATSLRTVLDRCTWHPPVAQIVTNHDARAVESADGWPARLERHLVEPVRWCASIRRCVDLGTDTFVEVGPGDVLGRLVRRIAPDAAVCSVQTPDDVRALPNDAHHTVHAERLSVPERVVIAPAAGTFEPSPVEEATTEGELVRAGQVIGHVTGGSTRTAVTSPFGGFFMGHLARAGERVRIGQPLAWLRVLHP